MTVLMTVSDLRTRLGGITTQQASDAVLQGIIDAVTQCAAFHCGPLSEARDEWHDGGSTQIQLQRYPILSVTAVVETYFGAVVTLTNQPLDGTQNVSGYTIDLATGIITRRSMGEAMCFYPGEKNVHVTYTAGRATVDPDLFEGGLELAQHWWIQSYGGGTVPYGEGVHVDFKDLPYAVQNRWARLSQEEFHVG